MKYIRTKSGKIFDTQFETKYGSINAKFVVDDNNLIVYDTIFEDRIANHGQIEKQADTIEELCDEFVFYDENNKFNPYLVYNRLLFRQVYDTHKQLGLVEEIYGAIWINKGLIYVAKMNEKGELELL